MRVGAYIGTISQGGSLTGIAASAAHKMAEVLCPSGAWPSASDMTHLARPVASALDTAAGVAPAGTAALRDGDLVEIRGATLRVIARGTAPKTSKQVAYLQPFTPPQARPGAPEQPATHMPALEASAALMALIADELGIEEAQPHRLEHGQATWVSTLIADYALLTAGAHFHAVALADSTRSQGRPVSRAHPTYGALGASRHGG